MDTPSDEKRAAESGRDEGSIPPANPDQPPRISNARAAALATGLLMTYFLGVASAYTLSFGCSLLLFGRLADLFGRKVLHLAGLVIYCVFNVLAGFMRSLIPVCLMRALAGIGLSLASPAAFGIIGNNIKHEPARTITFAALGLGGPIGTCTGSLLGGVIVGTSPTGWTYLFFLLGGLAVIPFTIGIFAIPNEEPFFKGLSKIKDMDWIGGILATGGNTLFLFSLTQSGLIERGWREPYIPTLFVVAFCLWAAFVWWELYLERRTSRAPVLRLSMFTSSQGRISAVCLCAFFSILGVSGWVYNTTIFYQNAIHVLPANVFGFAVAGSVLYLAPRVRAPFLIAWGGVASAIANMMYAVVPLETNYWACEFIANLLLPFGVDYPLGVGNVLMPNLVPKDAQSVAGALFTTSAQFGGALAICLSSLVSTQVEHNTGSALTGNRAASFMAMGFAIIVPICSLVGLRKVRLAKDAGKDLFGDRMENDQQESFQSKGSEHAKVEDDGESSERQTPIDIDLGTSSRKTKGWDGRSNRSM